MTYARVSERRHNGIRGTSAYAVVLLVVAIQLLVPAVLVSVAAAEVLGEVAPVTTNKTLLEHAYTVEQRWNGEAARAARHCNYTAAGFKGHIPVNFTAMFPQFLPITTATGAESVGDKSSPEQRKKLRNYVVVTSDILNGDLITPDGFFVNALENKHTVTPSNSFLYHQDIFTVSGRNHTGSLTSLSTGYFFDAFRFVVYLAQEGATPDRIAVRDCVRIEIHNHRPIVLPSLALETYVGECQEDSEGCGQHSHDHEAADGSVASRVVYEVPADEYRAKSLLANPHSTMVQYTMWGQRARDASTAKLTTKPVSIEVRVADDDIVVNPKSGEIENKREICQVAVSDPQGDSWKALPNPRLRDSSAGAWDAAKELHGVVLNTTEVNPLVTFLGDAELVCQDFAAQGTATGVYFPFVFNKHFTTPVLDSLTFDVRVVDRSNAVGTARVEVEFAPNGTAPWGFNAVFATHVTPRSFSALVDRLSRLGVTGDGEGPIVVEQLPSRTDFYFKVQTTGLKSAKRYIACGPEEVVLRCSPVSPIEYLNYTVEFKSKGHTAENTVLLDPVTLVISDIQLSTNADCQNYVVRSRYTGQPILLGSVAREGEVAYNSCIESVLYNVSFGVPEVSNGPTAPGDEPLWPAKIPSCTTRVAFPVRGMFGSINRMAGPTGVRERVVYYHPVQQHRGKALRFPPGLHKDMSLFAYPANRGHRLFYYKKNGYTRLPAAGVLPGQPVRERQVLLSMFGPSELAEHNLVFTTKVQPASARTPAPTNVTHRNHSKGGFTPQSFLAAPGTDVYSDITAEVIRVKPYNDPPRFVREDMCVELAQTAMRHENSSSMYRDPTPEDFDDHMVMHYDIFDNQSTVELPFRVMDYDPHGYLVGRRVYVYLVSTSPRLLKTISTGNNTHNNTIAAPSTTTAAAVTVTPSVLGVKRVPLSWFHQASPLQQQCHLIQYHVPICDPREEGQVLTHEVTLGVTDNLSYKWSKASIKITCTRKPKGTRKPNPVANVIGDVVKKRDAPSIVFVAFTVVVLPLLVVALCAKLVAVRRAMHGKRGGGRRKRGMQKVATDDVEMAHRD